MIVMSDATAVGNDVVDAFARLFPQLTELGPLDHGALCDAIRNLGTTIFIARDSRRSDRIKGIATLTLCGTSQKLRAWLEDVVVEESARAQGVGCLRCRTVMDQALVAGAVTLNLTSEPSREAANPLYCRLGFSQRQANNIYRYFPQKLYLGE